MKMLITGAVLAAALAPLALTMPASAAARSTVAYGSNASANWHDPGIRPPRFFFGAGQFYLTRTIGIVHIRGSADGRPAPTDRIIHRKWQDRTFVLGGIA